MLSVADIHTYYGDSYIIQGVSLEVAPGQIAVLMGRNGAGKTTTIRSIVGLTPPRRGTVRFRGEEVTRLPTRPPVRRRAIHAGDRSGPAHGAGMPVDG